jgi:hypothetical protein
MKPRLTMIEQHVWRRACVFVQSAAAFSACAMKPRLTGCHTIMGGELEKGIVTPMNKCLFGETIFQLLQGLGTSSLNFAMNKSLWPKF